MTQKNSSLPKSFLIFVLFMFLFHSVTIQIVVANEDDNETNNIEVTDSNNNEENSDNASNNSDNDQNESDNESDYNKKDQETSNNDIDNIIENQNSIDENSHSEYTAKEEKVNSKEDAQTTTNSNDTLEKDKSIINIEQMSVNSNALKRGDRHTKVIQLKKDLNALGFSNFKNPNNLFGVQTEQAVKDFQKFYKLSVDGVAGPATQNKLKEMVDSPFQSGKSHLESINIKVYLTILGYANFKTPNELYGSQTKNAVMKFQKAFNLPASGIADQDTRKKLKAEAKKKVNTNFLKSGDRHSKVTQLKKDLNKLGFSNFKNPNNYFADQTEAAVKKFQKANKLPQTGIADTKTQNTIKTAVNNLKPVVDPNALKRGDRHTKVIQLKKDLNVLGFSNFKNPNNLFGVQTEQAVKDFQKFYKLSVDGVAGPATQNKLKEMVDSPFQSGKSHLESINIKVYLTILGYANFKTPNELYGSQTKNAVMKFQKAFKLPDSGIADQDTRKKLKAEAKKKVNTNFLKSGDRHSKVTQLKKDLNKLGFSNFKNPNNYFADQTEAAVKKFQKANKLPQTGIADIKTQNKIKALVTKPTSPDGKKIKIYIDAGHGGTDSGALGNGLKEKDLTLKIAKSIEKHLRQYKNVEIKMSRTTDRTLSLKQRTDDANKWGADFFFSVHINSFTSSTARGFETFVHPTTTSKNKENQKIIHNEIMKSFSTDVINRGTKTANFHVLRESNMESMLAEYLFITNKSDSSLLKQQKMIDKIGKNTAQGIAKTHKLKK